MLILASLALAGPLPESEHPSDIEQVFAERHRWTLHRGVLARDDRVVVSGVVGSVAHVGDRVVAAVLVEAPVNTDLVVIDGGSEPRRLHLDARPDRVALSPDGSHVAYVSGHTGWASVWVLDLDTLSARQLTNQVVTRRKGAPPRGFTPPPTEPPRFEGDHLRWTTPDGASHRVTWR